MAERRPDRARSAPFAFDFRSRTPAAPLDRLVASIWYARGTVPYRRERIAPTGSTVAVIVLGEAIIETPDDGAGTAFTATRGFLLGPHDRPVLNEPVGETFAVGIVATPVGCEALFGVAPAGLRGRVVDLEATWPAASALRDALGATADPDAMLLLVEGHLRPAADRHPSGLGRCEKAVRMLEDDPTRPIGDIAATLGVSHGHLDRELNRIVGLTPRALSRLLRVRRLLAGLDIGDTVAWAALAGELGWYDQAHLIRDVKRHTGVTPTEYLAAQRAITSPVDAADAAGFVPET
ncbi:MAG: AraC family transcriptional regulator [Actinomycetota bacterium]|nr:AraC family transcriptional regulator [Actinomycetota bacterium]